MMIVEEVLLSFLGQAIHEQQRFANLLGYVQLQYNARQYPILFLEVPS